ncbi:MAG: hypothetical protein K0U56_07975 [Actinomycetia bacterium]|nr:hypothetical protein [Actinomycetes bacterium]
MIQPEVGWPTDLVAPHDPEFAGQVCRWLLDRLPGEFRNSPSRNDPVALAWVLKERVNSEIDLMRNLYATARTGSGSLQVEALLESLSSSGAYLVRTDREVKSVCSALAANGPGKLTTSDLD